MNESLLPGIGRLGEESAERALAELTRGLCRGEHPSGQTAPCVEICRQLAQRIAAGHTGLAAPPGARQTLSQCGLASAEDGEGEDYLFCWLPNDRLTFSGLWLRQQRMAHRLQSLAGTTVAPPAEARALLDSWFPEVDTPERRAAALALVSRLVLITGPPGSGKTYSIVRLAAMLLQHFADPAAIALAAYTGRAAMRLSMGRQFPDQPELQAALDSRCFTLHRLLQLRPGGAGRGSRPAEMASLKALIVDEASMIDTELLDELLGALPDDCLLVLVGDADQLPPIGIGAPFSALCTASSAPTDLTDQLTALAAAPGREHDDDSPAALKRLVRLTRSHRFTETSELARLARLIRTDPDAALELIEHSQTADEDAEIRWTPLSAQRREAIVAELARPWLDDPLPTEPVAALEHLKKARVLSSRRRGPWGAEQLSRDVARRLASAGRTAEVGARWPLHTQLMIERNDYSLTLRNGEMGVVLPQDGEARAHFPSPDGDNPRHLPLWLLPAHSSGWAISVHKSQGSEYQRVALVLPPEEGRAPTATRALLYTATTRARERLHLFADLAEVRAALHEVGDLDDELIALLQAPQVRPKPPVA